MAYNGQPVPSTLENIGGGKISDGKSIKVTVPESTTIEAGKFYLLDGILGCAVQSVTTVAGETAEVTLSIETAEFETDQIDVADAFTKGDKMYWDTANKRFTTVPTDGSFVGVVTEAKDTNNVIWFVLVTQQSVLKQAAAVVDVSSDDGVAAAGDAPTKAEFDAVVALANETKAQLNAALAAFRAAGLMAN